MASALVILRPRADPAPATGPILTAAPGGLRPSGRPRWPRRARERWLVRLGLALPLVALAVVAQRQGFVSTTHRAALAQAQALLAGGSDLRGVGAAYPPVPTLLAAVLPGGSLALSVVAALSAGVILQLLWEQLLALELPRLLVGALLSTVFGVPAVAYLASQSVAGILSLSLLTVALLGFIRFSAAGSTEGGFIAGLAFALAFLTSPIALFYALAVGAAAAIVAVERGRTSPGAVSATVGVLLFPAVFMAGAWAFLEWRFAGTAFHGLLAAPGVFAFPGGLAPSFVAAAGTVGIGLLHAPLYAVVGVLVARVRPVALVGYLLPVLGSVVATWIGLIFTQIGVYVFLTVLALTALPRRPPRPLRAVLLVVALAQLVLSWVWPPTSAGFTEWTSAMLSALHLL